MIRNCLSGAAFTALGLLFLPACKADTASPPVADIKQYIPADSDLQGWQRDGEAQIFRGEDLYIYIDGGADIYQEYGFVAVALQEYKDPGGKSLSLEVFEMKDAAAAFGMYTFKTSAEGEAVDLGGRGQLEDYYLNFWKGSYVVTLTGFDEEEATIQGLLRLGKAVDAKIESKGEAPSLPRILPGEGLNGQSVKYIRGWIGLNNTYSFFPRKIFSFDEGAKGDYEDGVRLIILSLDDPRPPESLLAEMGREFQAGDRYRNCQMPRPSFLQVDDDKGQTISAAVFKKYLIVALRTGQAIPEELIELAKRRIESAGF